MNRLDLIKEIKKKKELSSIADSVVSDVIDRYLKKNKFDSAFIDNLSKYDSKIIINEIRSLLRLYYGRFQVSNKKEIISNDLNSILLSHSSTKERISFYPELNKYIKDLNPKSILDLACGLNPLALALAHPQLKYYACDIDQSGIDIINKYFLDHNISGNAFIADLTNPDNVYPQVDLCILFKVLDIIEKRTHKIAQNLISNIKCKYFLISFATKTLSGKHMKVKRRFWLEKLSTRLGFNIEFFESDNEIFYLIKK